MYWRLAKAFAACCNCSMFCCTLLCVQSSIAIILMGKRELVALLNLSSWCLAMLEWLFLAVPWGCLRLVIVVFPDHTHLLFMEFTIPNCINKQYLTQRLHVYSEKQLKYIKIKFHLIFNIIKTKLILHEFHSSRYLQSK